MIIIGFDPGLTNTGYAVLSKNKKEIEILECGLISPKKSKILSERLYTIFFEANKLLENFQPDHISVENVFFGKNIQSAIKLGQAKSAVMLAAEHNKITSTDFSPREIKQSIVGNGSASKEQIAFMVKKIFKLGDEVFEKNDISDAIAVAWCGLNRI